MKVLVAAQLAALVVLGAITVARFQLFAPIDERAHYAFVQEVAEEGRLPVLGRDLISAEAQAINDGTWPQPSANDPRTLGFAGQSYEAFQPPLYYVLAAPVFAVAGDHRHKVFALRAFDLTLLAVAVGLLGLLARRVFKDRWLLPFSLALSVLLWPGVLARAVTVSNAALELPLVLAYLLAVWTALERRSARALLAAGALLGLCLLTKLTLVFLAPLLLVPAVTLLRERGADGRRAVATVAVALVLPAVMVAPWVASNFERYDAPTANALARDQQSPVLNAGGERPSVGDLPDGVARLADGVLPQEWWPEYDRLGLSVVMRLLPILLLLALAIPLVRRSARPGLRVALVLGAPIALAVATLTLTLLAAHWDIFFPRYLYSTLPALALIAGWAVSRGGSERSGLVVAAGSTAVIFALWVFVFGAYYFTDVGSSLGIHPAGG